MPTLTIHFETNDTTLLRLTAMAAESGLDAETIAKRALSEFLGAYGLKEVPADFRPATLRALFEERGLLEPQKTGAKEANSEELLGRQSSF